jgi:hypothetical protein
MSVRRRVCEVLALSAVFGAGWTASGLAPRPRTAHADVSAHADAKVPASGDACLDRHAMAANANLVEQVSDYRKRLALTRDRADTAEAAAAAIANAPPTSLVASRDEWIRMAREGVVRVRLPCVPGDGEKSYRGLSGVSDEEVDVLGEAYERARAKTWAAIRSACEANPIFRGVAKEREHDDTFDDDLRIRSCRDAILDLSEAGVRAAMRSVTQLRIVGADIERTTSDEQRVFFALTNASRVLYDEMVTRLGREKAWRAIDNGVSCVEEMTYFVQEPASPSPDDSQPTD